MKIYNTLTRKKEELIPLEKGKFKVYVCGPTVYNFIHIGNARPICVFDTLRKYLEHNGNDVTFVQNYTDIDDKIINKANQENVSFNDIATKFIKEFEIDSNGLNIKPATIHPKATETIDQIIEIIETLINKDFAYISENGDVYFRSKKFKDYGKLSNMPIDNLELGARIGLGDMKEDPLDFVLWKAAKEGEPYWSSPFSNGRPGWHIECSAMIKKHLGETIDIHCGGQDLVFPHHENEIAQSECANGKEYARYWMHNGYINIDNKKMSKSLNNFFTTRDVAEKYGYEAIRFLMLSSHYRTPINYSIISIEQSIAALNRLKNCKELLQSNIENASQGKEVALIKIKDTLITNFYKAMDDDLNTADAISYLFDFVKDTNTILNGDLKQSKESLEIALNIFNELCYIIGILQKNENNSIDDEIKELIDQRQKARENKDYSKSDEIRDKLKEMGVTLKDTQNGVTYTISK
ncbi:MAG: cysteine--tRNA ligase [Oscillospiraceae bacterium]